MADPVTTNLQLAIPTRGSDVGTWDIPINGDMNIIDACFGGVLSLTLSSSNTIALSVTQAQNAVFRLNGTITGNIDIVVPNINKLYTIENNCSSPTFEYIVRILPSGATSGVCCPLGSTTQIYVDGTTAKFANLPPVGTYLDVAGTSVPNWVLNSYPTTYLNCDGSTFSSSTFPNLARVLGGTTLPDLRGRSRAYLNQGTGRITSSSSGIDGNSLLSAGGFDTVQLSALNLPNITPTFTGTPGTVTVTSTDQISGRAATITFNGAQTVLAPGYGAYLTSQGTFTPSGTISGFGGNVPHQNMPPTTISGITLIRAG